MYLARSLQVPSNRTEPSESRCGLACGRSTSGPGIWRAVGHRGKRRTRMRGRRTFLATALAGGLLLATPTGAVANGGSYIEFDQTHYVPGDAGMASAYVSVPRSKAGLFDHGPFYLFAVPEGRLREGRPIPDSAIRLGTFTVEKEKRRTYELR